MLGFSIQKLLFTVAVVAAVWYGFKWLGRMKRMHDRETRDRLRRESRGGGSAPAGPSEGAAADAEDMVECAVCGAFVPARGAKSCGRADCPYPG